MSEPYFKFTKVRDVKSPIRAHATDACFDFFVPLNFLSQIDSKYLLNYPKNWQDPLVLILEPGEDVLIPSGIKAIIPQGYALIFFNKSGISTNLRCIKGAEVCDCGYVGEIHLHVINVGKSSVSIKPEMKLLQAALIPISSAIPKEITNEEFESMSSTERGEKGFGSSGS